MKKTIDNICCIYNTTAMRNICDKRLKVHFHSFSTFPYEWEWENNPTEYRKDLPLVLTITGWFSSVLRPFVTTMSLCTMAMDAFSFWHVSCKLFIYRLTAQRQMSPLKSNLRINHPTLSLFINSIWLCE